MFSGVQVVELDKDLIWGKIIIFSSDTCTELPAAAFDMTTTSIFPVVVGTVVEVNCKPGHTLSGDNSITCIKDVSFKIDQRPTCNIGLNTRKQ